MLIKGLMLANIIAALSMGTNIAINARHTEAPVRDAQIIVEVNRDLATLTDEGISNVQKTVLNNIRQYATNNVKLISSFSNIANAFAISVNTNDIEHIKQVPGVKSVTLNEIHWKTEAYHADDGDYVLSASSVGGEYGSDENISAETMYKPTNTLDGQGTAIAILDNEFYLRGATDQGATPAWSHETFTKLGDDVPVKYKYTTRDSKDTFFTTVKKTYGYKYKGKATESTLGWEGSLYFNNKVPYYFDYGGETTAYSGDPSMDYDVTSDVSYHGSHVASIAAGNAETYKGIAPKAQLICMKVFTNYKASAIDRALGLQSFSGAYDLPIMQALEDCMILGVDGINMSLGSNLDDFDSDSITNKVLHNLAETGILTSISAGNSGKTSYATVGSYANWTQEMTETGILSGYANDSKSMTIAAGQPTKLFYENGFKLQNSNVAFDDQIVNNENYDSKYTKEFKTEDLFKVAEGDYSKTLEWQYIPGFGAESDYGTLDVGGKLVVVNRGSTAFSDKYKVAANKGAIGLVIINNDPTSSEFNFRCDFGEDFRPTMPCSLVLYKDKELFSKEDHGTINLIRKEVVNNDKARTISSFSSDGVTYDLDLKPEITAPGELIRGAVPPQKTEDKVPERQYKVYEYLSGTSMSAPNYAGSQALLLGEVAGPIYAKEEVTDKDLKTIKNYASTIDMRLMSTAIPMEDIINNPENDTKSLTSPRKQGAGMVNLDGALSTKVYLEGIDENGNGISKSKINLRNNPDINKGRVALSFLAHNDSNETLTFDASFVVYRPAIAKTNDIITKDYNDMGTFDSVSRLPGWVYWEYSGVGEHKVAVRKVGQGTTRDRDVYQASKDVEYYASEEDLIADKKTVIKNETKLVWKEAEGKYGDLDKYSYQSTYDIKIAESQTTTVTVKPGVSKIELPSLDLTNDMKKSIADFYEYGCYLEGFVTLKSKDASKQCDLSMPYLGYYSTLNEQGGDYSSAPVVEPFSFEKDKTTVYPSDLVNQIAKDLLGKDKHDMGSMWVTGYVAQGSSVNVDDVIKNDSNFTKLTGFHEIGKNPESGQYYDDVKNNLFVGNPYSTNTMIVQQFVLRSVRDNFFSIVNKKTGKAVYNGVLEDSIRGNMGDDYPLFKSHVDDSYLGSGYVSHRAYAVIPLYDPSTGKAFDSGDYEIKFNYLLAATNTWVNKTYNLTIDSDAPEVSSITTRVDENTKQEMIDINIKEEHLVGAALGIRKTEFTKVEDGKYRISITKEAAINEINENMNYYQNSGRLFISLTDAAYGKMGVIVRFGKDNKNNIDFSKYVMVEHATITYTNDFEDNGKNVTVVTYDSESFVETPFIINDFVLVSRGPVSYPSGGCGGNIETTSTILCIVAALSLVAIFISKSNKKLGGKNNESK